MRELLKSRLTRFLDSEGRPYHPLPEEYRAQVVNYIQQDLAITDEPIEVYYFDEWASPGEVTEGSSLLFYGDMREAHDRSGKSARYEVLIFVRQDIKYPVQWQPAPDQIKQEPEAERMLCYPQELFICLTARELRRVWQHVYRHRGEPSGPLTCSNETDADRYASHMLARRREQEKLPPEKGKQLK